MTQQHGRKYEHDLARGLTDVTTDDVWAGCMGYSGNSAYGACDIVVTVSPALISRYDTMQYAIEAKKRTGDGGNRVTVFEGSATAESGVEEVERFVESTPDWAEPVFAIKFDRRKLVVLDARWIHNEISDDDVGIVPPDSVRLHGVRATDGGNVSMVKPSLDDWQSATAARDDELVLADKLSLPTVNDD